MVPKIGESYRRQRVDYFKRLKANLTFMVELTFGRVLGSIKTLVKIAGKKVESKRSLSKIWASSYFPKRSSW